MLKEVIDRVDPPAELTDHHPWEQRITGRRRRPDLGNNQPRHMALPGRLVLIHPASILVINEDEACPINRPGLGGSTKNGPLVRSIGLWTPFPEQESRQANRWQACWSPPTVMLTGPKPASAPAPGSLACGTNPPPLPAPARCSASLSAPRRPPYWHPSEYTTIPWCSSAS